MKRLLITGFNPFGGEMINPAWEAVSRLPEIIGEYSVHPIMIPTEFGKALERILEEKEKIQPDVIISVGQAGGRKSVTPEMVAINLIYAGIPDNAGNAPKDVPVCNDGPDAYFTTIPVRKMSDAIVNAGLSSAVSYSAGTFVCNEVMYSVLHHCKGTHVRAGFIHVPFLPEQAKDGQPSMPLQDICRALEAAISAL